MMFAADKGAPVQEDIPNKLFPDHNPKHIYATHIISRDLYAYVEKEEMNKEEQHFCSGR